MNNWRNRIRFFCCFVLIGLFVVQVEAQNKNKGKVVINAPRPKVGVVLGGGGAKGAAHIGVLKYIEEMGIPVDYVAGTSMGSIIGGLYAMGYTPDELAVLIANMNWSAYVGNSIDRTAMSPEMRHRNSTMFMNIPFSLEGLTQRNKESKSITSYLPSAYVNNTALINLFNDLCIGYQEDVDFNELPIPFACVATEMATGKEFVIRHGSVPTAMRASMAIPGVFSPVIIDGKVLVDGGLVNNFPADVLRDMGADIIIGVEITDKHPRNLDDIPSLPEAFSYLITNAVSSKRADNKNLCDLYLDPDITGYGTLSFTPDAIDTLVRRGYERAVQSQDQLLRIKQYVDQKAGYPVAKHLQAPKAKNLDDQPVFVSTITMNLFETGQGDWLAKKGGLKVGEFISAQDIDHAVEIYRGTGAFNDITYNILESDVKIPEKASETYKLVLNLKPTLPHVVGIGTRYDTEEGAAMLINLGLNEKRLAGYKLNLSGRLSYNPRVNVTATYSWIPVANFNLAYDYRSQHYKVMVQDQHKNTNLHYSQHQLSAYISQFQMLNVNSAIGLAYANTHFDQAYFDNNTYDTTGLTIVHSPAFNDNQLVGPFVNVQYDNLDHGYFAKQGIRSQLSAHLYFDPKKNGATAKDLSVFFESYFTPNAGKFTVIPQLYSRIALGCSPYANLQNAIGGDIPGRHVDQQMPFIGVSHLNEAGDFATVLRCDLRYNFLEKHFITGTYNALFGYNFSTAGKAAYTEFYSGIGLRYAYSSPIGPIALTAQWSNCTNQFSMYFSLGYAF